MTLLSAGCPVVASVNSGSEVARVIQRSAAGVVVEPENAEVLLRAFGRAETRAAMNERARAFAEESWDERRTLPVMEQQLEECVRRWRARQ